MDCKKRKYKIEDALIYDEDENTINVQWFSNFEKAGLTGWIEPTLHTCGYELVKEVCDSGNV